MTKIFTDSGSDLTRELIERYDITVIPQYVSFDKTTWLKEGIDITADEFYKKIEKEKVYPTTSLITIVDFEKAFKACLENGEGLLYIGLSGTLSGTFQNAELARQKIVKTNPSAKIEIVDSRQVSMAMGLIVLEACKLCQQNEDVSVIAQKIRETRDIARIVFTVDSLDFLARGGRIGKAKALTGALLNIKPVASFENCEVTPVTNVRGRRNAINKVISYIKEIVGSDLNAFEYAIVYGNNEDEAIQLKSSMEQMGFNIKLAPSQVGAIIGSHVGPTIIAIAAVKKL